MISSAVVVPDPSEVRASSPTLKRKQSSIEPEEDSKRRRLEDGSPNGQVSPPPATSPPRRKASGTVAAEERKRGQRLFGGLLGTLSQTSSTSAHKRRDEVERKAQDRIQQRQQERAEEEKVKAERLAQRRKEDQVVWDAQSRRIRHRNMRDQARFLKTTTEPVLYFKPWELRAEEEEVIRKQVEDVERRIAGEEENFSGKTNGKTMNVKQDEEMIEPDISEEQKLTSVDTKVSDIGPQQQEEESPKPDDEPPSRPPTSNGDKMNDDHHGEELVEGQEDDVIY